MENTEVLLNLKESILETARACDADLVGFVPETRLEGTGAEEGAFLPGAKTLIVFGFRMTRGLMRGIEEGTTYYQYTAGGIVNLDETVMPKMLYHAAMKIEEAGWLACPEFPNNPVRHGAFEPEHYGAYLRSDAGEEKLNLKLAAEKTGLGQIGMSGQLLRCVEQQARAFGLRCIRTDTHRKNKPMQRLLRENGYRYRGNIEVFCEPGHDTARQGYEKILKDKK